MGPQISWDILDAIRRIEVCRKTVQKEAKKGSIPVPKELSYFQDDRVRWNTTGQHSSNRAERVETLPNNTHRADGIA